MGNIFGHRQATPPPFIATVTERPRHCSDDHIAVTKTSCLSNSNTEIGTIRVLNPNLITTFICEFTSLSTRAIDFYNSTIDHQVSCDMPSLKTDLASFVNRMLQESKRYTRVFQFIHKLKSFSDVLFTLLVIFMWIYLMIITYWFNCSGEEGCKVLVMCMLLAGIGYFVSEFLETRVGILKTKEDIVFCIWLCTDYDMLSWIDFVVTTGCQDFDGMKERQQVIRNVKKIVFEKWKELSDLEDGRVTLKF